MAGRAELQVLLGAAAGAVGAIGACVGRLASLAGTVADPSLQASLRVALFAAMVAVNGLGTTLYVKALSAGDSSTLATSASTCANLGSLVVGGTVFFREAITAQRLAGCVLLALGVLCLQRASSAGEQHQQKRPSSGVRGARQLRTGTAWKDD